MDIIYEVHKKATNRESILHTHTEKSHIHRYTYPKKWKARIKDDPEKKCFFYRKGENPKKGVFLPGGREAEEDDKGWGWGW